MLFELQNVGAITNGKIHINENEINIKYGINGIGKSTISRALANWIEGDSLEELRTFGNDETPIIEH